MCGNATGLPALPSEFSSARRFARLRSTMGSFRVIIIGAGIVGLATGFELMRRYPDIALTILEKESGIARHQTGHNSGVIHSGIYYKPGSLKSRLAVNGARVMIRFCEEHGIPFSICGKVIVATESAEVPRLEELLRRGNANGLPGLRMLSAEELREVEPHAAGVRAIHVPGTAITNFSQVAAKLAELIRAQGGSVVCEAAVTGMAQRGGCLDVQTTRGVFTADYAINCAGLHSDRVAAMSRACRNIRITPFRGEYYSLCSGKEALVRGLIYPVPDPRYPFLGVHFTRRIEGGVEAGPNAVLALKREGYGKLDFSPADTATALAFPGLWKMAARNWKTVVAEYYRSFSTAAFVRALQKLVPELSRSDLRAGGAGVRAQALDINGNLLDDFQFEDSPGMTHVYNVPSPAATASLSIASTIADRVARRIALPCAC